MVLVIAIIQFICSSGSARAETLSLKVQDFIDATRRYHDKNNIYEVLDQLKERDDIIPMFKIKRIKTGKYYYTFCSPEACNSICSYLLSLNKKIHPTDDLFQISNQQFIKAFININTQLNLGKVGKNNRFRSHMLRKFHSSQLFNDGLSIEIIDSLQGRGKDSTHASYFMDNPERLREVYIEHMDAITINLDVNNLDMKSPEYVKMEIDLQEKTEEINKLEHRFDDMQEQLDKIQKSISWEDAMKEY